MSREQVAGFIRAQLIELAAMAEDGGLETLVSGLNATVREIDALLAQITALGSADDPGHPQ